MVRLTGMRKSVGVIAGCGLLAAASFVLIDGASSPVAAASGLTPFDTCDAAVSYLKDEAIERMGPYGVNTPGGFVPGGAVESGAVEDAAGADGSSPTYSQDDAGRHSTTNVQEAAVDEPDVVKTDGEILVTAVDDHIRVYDVTGAGEPREISTVDLGADGYGAELLLVDDTLLAFSTSWVEGWREDRMPLFGGHGATTVVTQIDVSDPADPEVTGTLEIDAEKVDVRRSGDRVFVVTVAQPRVEALVEPGVYRGESNRFDEHEQANRNKQAVSASTAEDWLPGYRLEVDGASTSGLLVDCSRLHRPSEFPGFGTVSVVSLDLDEPLSADNTTAVLSGGDLVYATAETLYVTTNNYDSGHSVVMDMAVDIGPGWALDTSTAIHAFALADDGPATYLASGTVHGGLKDRFALSEHEGVLRVATTVRRADRETESQIVALAREGNELVEIGAVGGLGKTEQIYAVRYLGDTAYVVTFRQTDPLYVIDLSDPRQPRVSGELKITGYSGYLHDVGDGRLVGVGQEATEQGRTIGAQVSLFDVSDPSAPRKLDGHVVEGGWTSAEMDPHAFLYWPGTGQLIVPMSGLRPEETGSLVLTVGADTVEEQGFVPYAGPVSTHGEEEWWAPYVLRNVVVQDRVYTVWDNGLQVSTLDSLDPIGFASFETSTS